MDVDPSHAFRNFFGMVVYGIIPILIFYSVPSISIIRIVVAASVFTLLYQIYSLYFSISLITSISEINSLSELRVAYNSGTVILFPLLAISAASVFYKNWRQRIELVNINIIFKLLSGRAGLLFLLTAIIVPSMSKGWILTCVLILITAFCFSAFEYFRRGVFPIFVFSTFVIVAIGYFLMPTSIHEVIAYTFSQNDISNKIRSEQAQYLINEFSIFGSGLGSALLSGYVRDDTGYGFELTYLNLIHKLGIFSSLLFLAYFFTVLLALYRIWHQTNLFESYFVFGLMGFLISGAGNPILLSPTTVTLHAFAIYILLVTGDTLSNHR